MEYFKKYVSNTLGEGANQLYILNADENEVKTGRVYYKIFKGGRMEYSLLYSNIIDSTYADGAISHNNLVCDNWTITELKVGKVADCSMTQATEPESMQQLTFGGNTCKEVAPGEFFNTDPFWFEAEAGEYMCIEISFKGRMIPYHEEIQKQVFVKENGVWVHNQQLPVPGMVGCVREVPLRVAFLGDSITQGIGATPGSYNHWNALTAEKIGTKYSFWNLGIGYARAHDASAGGSWMFKAKQADVVLLCLGANDLLRGLDHKGIALHLKSIIQQLKAAGCKVLLQSIPPLAEEMGELAEKLQKVNEQIRTELAPIVDGYFEQGPYICRSADKPYQYRCQLHPDDAGYQNWADALTPYLETFLDGLLRK